jgi:hypothetical protein
MFCTNCGKEQVDNPKFCRSCGTKLVQESVIQSDIKAEIRPSVEPRVNQGIQPKVQRNIEPGAMLGFQPKPRSAALKWATGLLFVLTVIYLIIMIGSIYLIRVGYEPSFFDFLLNFPLLPLALAAAICATRREHWGYVLSVAIWLPVSSIPDILNLFASRQIDLTLPLFLAEITCLILISRTKAEFS